MVDCNPYDLGDVAAKMRRMVNERASLAGPLAGEVNGLRRELAETRVQRNELLAACEKLCAAIKEFGQSQCDRDYDGPSLEFIEENWQDSTLGYLLDAYKAGEAVIAKATEEGH